MKARILFLLPVLAILASCEKEYNYNANPSHFTILAKHSEYYNESSLYREPFTYSPPSNEILQQLREEYPLEKVAGKGSELSKIKNLMHWVSVVTEHDALGFPFVDRNGLDLLRVSHQQNYPLNCRLIAIILNDVYLAMGFHSRIVACYPADMKDEEYHVINAVFSETLNKWIYMDANFNAFFLDEKGVLLSPREVRERIIQNKPLRTGSTLNVNGIKVGRTDYINYMTKNMFRFASPIHSGPNYESGPGIRTYYYLQPAGTTPNMETIVNHNMRRIYLSNPAFFWGSPLEDKRLGNQNSERFGLK